MPGWPGAGPGLGRRGTGGLLLERDDAVAIQRGPRDAEAGCPGPRDRRPGDRHAGHGDPGAPGPVRRQHLPRVHPVDVIGAEHRHHVGPLVIDQVERLEDRVGRAGLPVRADPLLRRDRRHVIAHDGVQPPGGAQVPVQAVALVLGQHADPPPARVGQVGQREVNYPVQAAERDGWFRPVGGQRRQALATPAGQNDAQYPLPSHRLPPYPDVPVSRCPPARPAQPASSTGG